MISKNGNRNLNKWELEWHIHKVASYSPTVARSNLNLEMLVLVEGGKPEYPEKNPWSRNKNQQQTQPTYDVNSENRTRATLLGGECSHHCALPEALATQPDIADSFLVSKITVEILGITQFSAEHPCQACQRRTRR